MRTICRYSWWLVPANLTLAYTLVASGCGDSKPTEQTTPSTTHPELSRDLLPPTKKAAIPADMNDTPEIENQRSLLRRWVSLDGTTGSSSHWGSGWLDLATPIDFQKDTRLRVRVGGTAKKIFVRILSKGISPDSSRGIVGGAITIPENRVVEVRLDVDRKGIKQISVHGGPNPWNKQLGPINGPATLEAVEVLTGE